MAQAKLTEEQKAEARAIYVANPLATVDDLAEAYGVVRSTMLRVLAGVTRPAGGRRKPVSDAAIKQLREADVSMAQIGKQVGMSESGVWRRLHHERRTSDRGSATRG